MERKASVPKQNVSWAPEIELSLPSKGMPPIDDDEDSHHLAPSDIEQDSDDLEELF